MLAQRNEYPTLEEGKKKSGVSGAESMAFARLLSLVGARLAATSVQMLLLDRGF